MTPLRKRLADLGTATRASIAQHWGTLVLGLAFLVATTGVAATSHAQDLPMPTELPQGTADPWTYVALGVVYLLGQGVTLLKAHLEATRGGIVERAERAAGERDKALEKLEALREELGQVREERVRLETRVMLAERDEHDRSARDEA